MALEPWDPYEWMSLEDAYKLAWEDAKYHMRQEARQTDMLRGQVQAYTKALAQMEAMHMKTMEALAIVVPPIWVKPG